MQPSVIPVWSQVPLAQGNEPDDIPDIAVYDSEKPNGAAMIICPGGGYHTKVTHEKEPVVRWMTERGITAFLLNYRVGPRYHHPAPWLDAAESIRLVRARSQEFAVDPRRIGVIGFSAGGHLAAHVSTTFDTPELDTCSGHRAISSRPDLMILVYPVINMFYGGSRLNLLGEHPDESLAAQVCPDRHVSDQTPPAFLVHAADDVAVPCQDSLNMALALRSHGVSVELHLYERGGHGFGGSPMAPKDPVLATWLEHLETWLKGKGF